jgi:UDP-N-acetyl-2-amino-2-deoxyglucuronate dehydrogenase
MSKIMHLTEDLVRTTQREVADSGPPTLSTVFSEADYDEHLAEFLAERPDGPLYVFCYGYLIWKSVFEPAATAHAIALGATRLHRMEGEDIACAALRFGNGAIGGLDASTAVYPGFPERYEFVFESATALMVTDDLTLYRQDGTMEQLVSAQSHGGGADPMAYSREHHRNIIEDFLDALDEDRDPLVTGEEALKTHRLIDALVRSSRDGRAVAAAV